MRTVRTEKVDGFDVVVGFDFAVVDPMATRAKISEALKDEPEKKRIDELSEEINQIFNEANETAKSKIKPHMDKDERRKIFLDERAKAQVEIDAKGEEIHSYLKTLVEKRNRLKDKKKVFFQPAPGEEIISEDTFQSLRNAEVLDGFLLLRDGSQVADDRGKFYWEKKGNKWIKTKIKQLGFEFPNGAKFFDDLSADQQDEAVKQYSNNYLSTMSDDDFADLLATKNEETEMEAKRLLRSLESVGDPAAKKKVEQYRKARAEHITDLENKRVEK